GRTAPDGLGGRRRLGQRRRDGRRRGLVLVHGRRWRRRGRGRGRRRGRGRGGYVGPPGRLGVGERGAAPEQQAPERTGGDQERTRAAARHQKVPRTAAPPTDGV